MNGYKFDIGSQLRESYGRLLYTYTTHNKESMILQKKLQIFNITEIILSAITTTGLVGVVFTNDIWQDVSLIISLILSTILLVIRLINPNETLVKRIDNHKRIANKMWFIKEQYLCLLTDLNSMEALDVTQQRDTLIQELDILYKSAPQTSEKAYKMAQKSLKKKEEQFFTIEELNNMLPEHLRVM